MGDPQYPSPQIPLESHDLVAVERGNRILITFTIPARTTDGVLLRRIDAVDLRVSTGTAPFPSKEWADQAKALDIEPPEKPQAITRSISIAGLEGKTVTIAERTMGGRHHYSAWSNPATFDVLPPVAPPTGLTAKSGPNGVELKWNAEGATSYRIFRKADDEKTPAFVGDSPATAFTDHGSGYDTHYEYYVQALHDKAESEVSEPAGITPVDIFPPAVPSGLAATPGINSIELSWERNTESDFRAYIVYRAVDNGPFEKLAETDSPVYSDQAVKSGTSYRYAISAVDQKNNKSAMTPPVEAAAP